MKDKILEGNLYIHFKGDLYFCMGLAKHSETGEELVIYKSCSDQSVWARPADMFLGKVTRDGKTVSRFSPVIPLQQEGA